MNEYINNFHSHSPTKMVSWLLLPHLPNGGFLSSYPFCNAQLFINPNPNPETAFFQKKRQTPTPRFTDTHLNMCISSCILTPPHFPSPPCFWAFCSLIHLKMFIIFYFIYYDVSCNEYLPFQLCSSWKVLSPWRGDFLFFIFCTQSPHPPPHHHHHHSLPPSRWVSEKWG